jgi:hypothetical protein
MLKRWAAWPPGIRWPAAIAAIMLAAAVVWALFVPLADWLAHHDVGSAAGALHETALDDARGRLLTLARAWLPAGRWSLLPGISTSCGVILNRLINGSAAPMS